MWMSARDAVEQSADQPQLGLLDEFDVDQHERQVGVEARQERLAHHGPGPYDAPTADRGELKPGSVLRQFGQTTSGGIVSAASIARSVPRSSTCLAAAAQNGADDLVGDRATAARSWNHPLLHQLADPIPVVAELLQQQPQCARRARARDATAAPARRTAPAPWAVDSFAPPSRTDLAHIAVGGDLRVLDHLVHRLHRRPRRIQSGQ